MPLRENKPRGSVVYLNMYSYLRTEALKMFDDILNNVPLCNRMNPILQNQSKLRCLNYQSGGPMLCLYLRFLPCIKMNHNV